MKRKQSKFKCPLPIEDIRHKKVHASFTRDEGATVETGTGEIMVTVDAAGLSTAWIQFNDTINLKLIRLYLNEERLRLLQKVDHAEYDYVIEQVLDAGQEIS